MSANPIPLQSARFMTSCATHQQFPEPLGPEIAFAGRSNAGKSSTLNKLCGRRKLAHVSKTPGRTQMINFFELSDGIRLVDLPGYGFAKVPEQERRRWGRLIESYLHARIPLLGLVIVMDIRHPLKDQDWQMLRWCEGEGLAAHVLLNKADKLKSGARQKVLQDVQRELQDFPVEVSVQAFSASSGLGLDKLIRRIADWLERG